MLEAMLVILLLVLLWPLWLALAALAMSVVVAIVLFIAGAVGLWWLIFEATVQQREDAIGAVIGVSIVAGAVYGYNYAAKRIMAKIAARNEQEHEPKDIQRQTEQRSNSAKWAAKKQRKWENRMAMRRLWAERFGTKGDLFYDDSYDE